MPYWVTSTIVALPSFLWVYAVIGIPFALLLLPRSDWRYRSLVLMTAFAVGPGLLTTLMLALGSLGEPLLTRENVMIGVALLTLVGWVLVSAKITRTEPHPRVDTPLALTPGEGLIIAMIGLAVVVRIVVIAYWPFTAYDALWVYGYQGRLYFLTGLIPSTIDYYPQFLQLQYTFGQLAIGDINDSAARAVLPLLHIGAILAAYNLGARLFNRRTGIFLVGLWALYPAVGEWGRMGDLEIPLAFLVTASAVFFFQAWNAPADRYRNRYALIAGLIYGIALWTKPTAGAFALGVILINMIEVLRLRFNWSTYRGRFTASVLMALACAPLGGVWYLRNLALGHNAVDFPPDFWHTLAERGGGQLLWPAAGLTVLCAYLLWQRLARPLPILGGLVFVGAGIIPSATARFYDTTPNWLLILYPSLDGLPRMGGFEWAMVGMGVAVIVWGMRDVLKNPHEDARRAMWVLLAAVPYFTVYFSRYSYHVRLSFAIVPMLALPIAVVLARWLPNTTIRASSFKIRWAVAAVVVALGGPGIVYSITDRNLGWDYLWTADLADDTAKRESGNSALMWMVDGFNIYEAQNRETPIVVAPGVQRLPFFFPLGDMRIEAAPTQLREIEDAVYFVDSHPDGTGMYEDIPLAENQVLSALGREDITRWAWGMDDGIFRYDIYELSLENRYQRPTPIAPADGEVVVGGYARLLGHDLGLNTFEIGQRRVMKLFWEVLTEPQNDYMIYIHLRDPDGTVQQAWDGPVALTDDGRYYTTLVWEPGEFITDEREMRLTNLDVPPGEGYRLVVGMYDLVTGERVPITQDDVEIGDGYDLGESITVVPPAGGN